MMERRIMGEAANNPAVQRSARRMRRQTRDLGERFVEELLTEAAVQGHNIQFHDFELLLGLEKRPRFLRSIIIELMVCIREKPK